MLRGPGGGGGPRSIFTFWLFLKEEHASKPKLFDFENLGSGKITKKNRFKIFKIE